MFLCLQRVNLSFDFPFYGHLLKEITVATGGESLTSLSVVSVEVVSPKLHVSGSFKGNPITFFKSNNKHTFVSWNSTYLISILVY